MPAPKSVVNSPASSGRRAIFISYRSADGKKDASRLAEDLRALFGASQVFFDKHDLQGGSSWRQQIEQTLDQQPVVLLVISELFFGATNEQGRRIDQADDPVRMEVLDSIQCGARLLPLLCEGVRMPASASLPAELRSVPEAHALKLRTEDWRVDLLKLTDQLVAMGITPLDDDWREQFITPPGAPRGWRLRQPLVLGAIAVLIGLSGGGAFWLHQAEQERVAEISAARHQRALQLLSAGLEAHRGKDVNLDLAQVQYLAALQEQPDYGPAHYFLAQIYAIQRLREDAQGHYRSALQFPAGLDNPQLADARRRLAALDSSESEPVAIGAAQADARPTTAGAEPPVVTAAAPAPVPMPAPTPVPVPAPPRKPATSAATTATSPRPPGMGSVLGSARPPVAALPPLTSSTPSHPITSSAPATVRTDAVSLVARVPAQPERLREAQTQADALFADDAVTRLTAATTLGVELGMASDVLPLALQRALTAASHSPMSEGERAGAIATLRLLGMASPLSLQAQRSEAEKLFQVVDQQDTMFKILGGAVSAMQKVRTSVAQRPRVYIQIGSEAQRAYAAALVTRLQNAGYEVPGIENIGAKAPARTDLRAQGFSNLGLARWMGKVLGEAGAGAVAIQVLRRAQPAVDTYEIWLGRDLCVAPDQQPPACQPAGS